MSYKKSYIVLNLNKKEVRAKIPPIEFGVARRLVGPIYDVLIKELSEHGCQTSAKYFRCLANKERHLFEYGSIRDRIEDNSELLYQIFDYCITAEKDFHLKDCNGLASSFHNIYQLLILLEEQGITFQWLLKDIYKIVVKIIRSIDPNISQPQEIIARIYYMYGLRLSHTHDELPNSLKCLRKALELCRGQKWLSEYKRVSNEDPCTAEKTDTTGMKTLHELAAYSLAEVTTKYAKSFDHKYSDAATEMTKEAMLLIAEVGINTNKYEFYNAFITYAEYLAMRSNHNDAMKLLNKFDMYFKTENIKQYSRLYCKQFMIRGTCHENLNNIKEAKKDHQRAISIARHADYKDLEADAHVHLGMLYALKSVEYTKSKVQYEKARRIYLQLGDRQNETKTHYLLAKLRATEMFPFFYDMLKYTAENPCDVYKLRRWKDVCEPFWIGWSNYLTEAAQDHLCCLLKSDSALNAHQSYQLVYHSQSVSKQQTIYKKYAVIMSRSSEARRSSISTNKTRYSSRILKKKSSGTVINPLHISPSVGAITTF